MALIDKASLLMVPSTYEAGTLYNVLPSGNRAPDETGSHSGYDQTRADFTFDRGTNAAATRIGSDGLIKKYRENYFKNSNAFNLSPWSIGATLTSGQADKDGGTDAWLFAKSGASNSDYYNDTTINGVQTFSIYVKKQSGVGIKPYFFGSVNGYATINLEDGSKYDASSAIIDYKAEAYNDNWWRVSVTINASSGNWYIYVTDGTNTQTTTPITIQNAQLESGLVSTDYLDSGATTAKAGVLVDLPRINYDANGENGSLLLEPQRQQLFEFSEYLGDSSWSKDNITLNTNDSQSPEGVNNASLIYPTATQSSSPTYIYNSTSGASSKYTISAFVKADGIDVCWLYISSSSTYGIVYFDLSDESIQVVAGSASTPTGTIASAGNGWYRITATLGAAAAIASGAGLGISDAKGNWAVTKNGEDGVLVYGMQIEAGSYVSSYIPNHGTSGGVTRAADSCNNGELATDLIGQQSGVIYAEFKAPSEGSSSNWFNLSRADSTADWIFIGKDSNKVRGYVRVGGVVIWSDSSNVLSSGYQKVALRYKSGDIALFINGVKEETSSATYTITNTLSRVSFGTPYSGPGEMSEYKEAMVFDSALTDAECITLTTL